MPDKTTRCASNSKRPTVNWPNCAPTTTSCAGTLRIFPACAAKSGDRGRTSHDPITIQSHQPRNHGWPGSIRSKNDCNKPRQLKFRSFNYLTDQDWLDAVKDELNTDDDYRRALSRLRDAAEKSFITTQLQPALNQYGQANNGQFPTDLSQLQSYFNPPVDDSMLQRWEIAPAVRYCQISADGRFGDHTNRRCGCGL
jgi:hypothetical protein